MKLKPTYLTLLICLYGTIIAQEDVSAPELTSLTFLEEIYYVQNTILPTFLFYINIC